MNALHTSIMKHVIAARKRDEIGEGMLYYASTSINNNGPCCVMAWAWDAVGYHTLSQYVLHSHRQRDSSMGVPEARDQDYRNMHFYDVDCAVQDMTDDEHDIDGAIALLRTAFEEMDEGIFGMQERE